MQNYDDPQVLARLAALKTMTVKELKAEWAKLMGSEAPNNSSQFMIQRLSYRVQELAFGGMSKPLVRTLNALADEYEGKKVRKSVIADPRHPIIGTRLVRGWNGTEHTVTVKFAAQRHPLYYKLVSDSRKLCQPLSTFGR